MFPRHRWPAALFIAAALAWLPALISPGYIDDEGIYGVVAREIFHGGLPYVDAIERKPPLLFYVYAWTFHLAGGVNWLALHIVAFLWVLATMAGIHRFALAAFDRDVARTAALLYGVFLPFGYFKNFAFNGEVMMNLPVVWAYALALGGRRHPVLQGSRAAASGALLALAFLFKQPAAIAAIPLGLYFLAWPWHSGSTPPDHDGRPGPLLSSVRIGVLLAGAFTLGFAGVLGACALLLDRMGILEPALHWTVFDHDVPHGPGDPIFWFRASVTLGVAALWLPLSTAAALAVAGPLRLQSAPHRWLLLGLLGASFVGVATPGRFYPHYFIQLLPALTWLAAPVLAPHWFARGRSNMSQTSGVGWRRVLLSPWLAAALALSFCGYGVFQQWPRSHPDPTSEAIKRLTSPEDRIFIWGQGTKYYLRADRRPASRFIATFPLTGYIFGSPKSWDPTFDTSDRILPGAWDTLMAELTTDPPRLIVDHDGARTVPRYPMRNYPQLWNLIEREYERVADTPEGILYLRKSSER
ncbi:MAG: glycosyltransferase family 39 protein [Myxococcales bacterium]|nr:glycosyltransferase family 39 protein [Myxococcales bacterium]